MALSLRLSLAYHAFFDLQGRRDQRSLYGWDKVLFDDEDNPTQAMSPHETTSVPLISTVI